MKTLAANQTLLLKKSILGPLVICVSEQGLKSIEIGRDPDDYPEAIQVRQADAQAKDVIEQLKSYFAGELKDFTCPLDIGSITPFQHKVLKKARTIPYGETWAYADLAMSVSKPGAQQAIGQVMKRNPIPIIFPCHRVVARSGLGGFNCGIDYKRILLKLENPENPYCK